MKASKNIIKKHIYDLLSSPEIMTIPLTMRHVKVLAVTKGKDFLQYSYLIKSGSNIRNPSTSFVFFTMIMDKK